MRDRYCREPYGHDPGLACRICKKGTKFGGYTYGVCDDCVKRIITNEVNRILSYERLAEMYGRHDPKCKVL